jgi:YesN/AraC family two-component response regulator
MARQMVLIVDDEGSIRATLVKFLKSIGVQEILEAANGQEALEKVGANPQIKLIIMDLKMPVMDGLQTLEKIRAVNAQVKVAILTGYPFYEQADQAVKKLGTIDFITKPVDLDYLERIVSLALSE